METVTPFALSTTALIGYGYGIILAIGGLYANFKIQKTTMKKVADESNEPIKEDMLIVKDSLQEQHKKIINNSIALKKVTDITNPLMINKVFFCKLMKIAVDSVEYREDKNLTYYNNKVATSLVGFSREIIDYGIDKVSDGTVDALAKEKIKETALFFIHIWGKELHDKYKQQTEELRQGYISKIKSISNENFNSKDEAYRAETLLYMREITKGFMKFYDEHLTNMVNNEQIL